jgi:hypothetical protein
LKLNRIFILLFLLAGLLTGNPVLAQTDTLRADTLGVDRQRRMRIKDPIKATMMAAAFPGLGQVYNGKAWKIPVVYAGFAAVGYSIYFNSTNHVKYLEAYIDLTDDIPETNSYTFREFGVPPEEFDRALGSSSFNASTEDWVKTQLINGVDYYRRYRDLSYVGVAVWYLITILDANVDAHLSDYDVSENLNIALEPTPLQTAYGPVMGMGVKITF